MAEPHEVFGEVQLGYGVEAKDLTVEQLCNRMMRRVTVARSRDTIVTMNRDEAERVLEELRKLPR